MHHQINLIIQVRSQSINALLLICHIRSRSWCGWGWISRLAKMNRPGNRSVDVLRSLMPRIDWCESSHGVSDVAEPVASHTSHLETDTSTGSKVQWVSDKDDHFVSPLFVTRTFTHAWKMLLPVAWTSEN